MYTVSEGNVLQQPYEETGSEPVAELDNVFYVGVSGHGSFLRDLEYQVKP